MLVHLILLVICTSGCSTCTAGDRDLSDSSADDAERVVVACGYENRGQVLRVTESIEICIPPAVCTPATCPPGVARCVDGECVYGAGYRGLETFPEAWVTHYCNLSAGECAGVSQFNGPEVTAALVAEASGHPLCGQGIAADTTCVGVVASPPMMVGNSELAVDPITGSRLSNWGLGLTEANGLCYELVGPHGAVVAAMTNRCGGWCTCGGSGIQECGGCVNASDMRPNCPCVGDVPGLTDDCCGRECSTTDVYCDWCASNNHPHFDLDDAAFEHVCGADASLGSCRLTSARFVPCLEPIAFWPPGGASCRPENGMFYCEGVSPNPDLQPVVPNSLCCCNWGLTFNDDGTCSTQSQPPL